MISFNRVNKQYGRQILFVDASVQAGGFHVLDHAWRTLWLAVPPRPRGR